MFGERKVSALVRRYAEDRGWHILSIYQPQQLFRRDVERKHSRVALPCDPWWVTLGDAPSTLLGEQFHNGVGDTPDEAVLAAIPHDLISALRRCEAAVDSLRGCLQK